MPPLLSFHGGARSCTLALTTAIALGLSACGGGSDDDSTDGGLAARRRRHPSKR